MYGRSAPEALDEIKAGNEFRAPEYRRDDRRKTQGGPKSVTKCGVGIRPDIDPVLSAEVEGLKNPPDRGGDQEETHIFSPAARQQGRSRPPENKRIHGQAKAQPHREETPLCTRAIPGPIDYPENNCQGQAEPAVGRKFIFQFTLTK